MDRIHLFEFEDQEWLPSFLRDYMTDFLSHLANSLNIFKPILPLLEKGLKSSSENRVLDLGSGAGGGWIKLSSLLEERSPKTEVLLTDYFPNKNRFNQFNNNTLNLKYLEEPIDARDVPPSLQGLRTLFLVFHHFRPKDALRILQNSVNANQPIAIIEGQERSVQSIIGMIFSPVTLFLITPLIKPFKFSRIIFTYIIPILPLLVFWDGVVSCLRTYSPAELRTLIEGLEGGAKFEWTVGQVKSGPSRITYLVGVPATPAVPELDVTV